MLRSFVRLVAGAALHTGLPSAPARTCLLAERLEDRCTPTFWINTTADTPDVTPGDGKAQDATGKTSLRSVIMEGNALKGVYDVQFDPNPMTFGMGRTIELTSPLPVLTTDFGIYNPYTDTRITVKRSAAAGNFRIFEIGEGSTTGITNLVLNDGRTPNIESSGGNVSNSGTLTLDHCWVVNGKALSGGGISSSGTLNLIGCDVYYNTATDTDGGGVDVRAGKANFTSTAIYTNSAARDGGGVCSVRG